MSRRHLRPRPARPTARRASLVLVPALALALAGAAVFQAAAAPPPRDDARKTGAAETAGKETGTGAQARPWAEMRQRSRQRLHERAVARKLSPDERQAAILENAWWNEADLAGRLHLTEARRRQMDDMLRKNLAGRRDGLEKSRDAQKSFYEALEAGNLDAATSRLGAVETARASILHAELGLRLDVAKLLSPEQRKVLDQARPRLWRDRWVHVTPYPTGQERKPPAAKEKAGK